jgi:hypothetical protein
MAIRHDGRFMYLEYDLPPVAPYNVRVQSFAPGSQSPSTLAYGDHLGGWRPTGITATPDNHFQIYFTTPIKTGDGLWRTALAIWDVDPNGNISYSPAYSFQGWDVYGNGFDCHGFAACPFDGGDGMLNVAWNNGNGTAPSLMTINPADWSIVSWYYI